MLCFFYFINIVFNEYLYLYTNSINMSFYRHTHKVLCWYHNLLNIQFIYRILIDFANIDGILFHEISLYLLSFSTLIQHIPLEVVLMKKHIVIPTLLSSLQFALGFSIIYFLISFSSTLYSPTSIVNASEIHNLALDVNVYIEESRIGTSFYINTRSHNYKGEYVPLPSNPVTNN